MSSIIAGHIFTRLARFERTETAAAQRCFRDIKRMPRGGSAFTCRRGLHLGRGNTIEEMKQDLNEDVKKRHETSQQRKPEGAAITVWKIPPPHSQVTLIISMTNKTSAETRVRTTWGTHRPPVWPPHPRTSQSPVETCVPLAI